MAIWSLTKEKVEKLLQQIGDKEMEIDTLIKLTKEDLWTKDLDDFIAEWRFQLDDEAKRQKKVASLGRRASMKLKFGAKGPAAKKRKQEGDDPDDSDFGGARAKKPAVINRVAPKPGAFSYLNKGSSSTTGAPKAVVKPKVEKNTDDGTAMQLDGVLDSIPAEKQDSLAPIFKKARSATVTTQAPKPVNDDTSSSEVEELPKPAPGRKPRAAAKKVIKYDSSSDSDEDGGDDMLGDVSKMVKGIGGNMGDPSGTGSRALFSASVSRPGSSAGLPKGNTKHTSKTVVNLSDDETDYLKLVPQSTPQKAAIKTAKESTLSSNEEDSFDEGLFEAAPKPSKPLAKSTTKATKPVLKPITAAKPSKAVPKKSLAAPVPPKKAPLSPAAKAYAAKQAKTNKKKVIESDDDEDEVAAIADDILNSPDNDSGSEPSPPPVAAGRASRRAAASSKKYIVDEDSEEPNDNDGFSQEDSESE